MNKRVIAIKVFAILLLLISLFSAIYSIILAAKYVSQYRAEKIEAESQSLEELFLNTFSEEGIAKAIFTPGIKDIICVSILLVFSLLNIYSAYGLFWLSPKIRFPFLIISAVFTLLFIYVKFISHPLVFIINRWAMKAFFSLALLNICGFILLMLPKIKEQFTK